MKRMFVESAFGPAHTDVEVQEDDGSWQAVTWFKHKADHNIVLWWGGDVYEGLGSNYRWSTKEGVRRLLDGDGDAITTRPLEEGGGRTRSGKTPAASATKPSHKRKPKKRPAKRHATGSGGAGAAAGAGTSRSATTIGPPTDANWLLTLPNETWELIASFGFTPHDLG